MDLHLDLTESELFELRQRTELAFDADAVAHAVREFLRICRLRELTSSAARFDYDDQALAELDRADLAAQETKFDLDESGRG